MADRRQNTSSPAEAELRTLVRPALVVLAFKLLLFLSVYLSTILLPPIFSTVSFKGNFHWPPDQTLSRVTMLETWDAQHYLFLSEEWYQPDHMSTAMYPLWPALIRLGQVIFGGSLVSALILGNLFSLVGLTLLHRLVREQRGVRAADTSLLLALAFPGALFYCFAYTESLFLLLAVSCFMAIERQRFAVAAIFAFLLPTSKALGLFIALPLGYGLFKAWKEGRATPSSFALLLAPAFGLVSVCGIIYLATGSAFSHFEAQSAYVSQGSLLKVLDARTFVTSFLQIEAKHSVLHSPFDRTWFVIAILGLCLMLRQHKMYFIFSLPIALIPAVSMSFMAYTRYVIAAFPLFIIFGIYLSRPAWRELRWLSLASLAAIQLLFLIRHVNNHWAG